jgi:RNA polymerase sigma factor (sigma-70 family)
MATSVLAVTDGLTELVTRARDGDRRAWEELVARLKGVVWRVTADLGLAPHDRADVFAAAFFRLVDRLDTIREPEKLAGWLATTARNEGRQLLRARSRVEPRDDLDPRNEAPMGTPGEELLQSELRVALREAFRELEPLCQELLRLVTAVPPISYDEISSVLGVPRGSLGPNRQRCLERLRRSKHLKPFVEEAQP